MVRIAICDNDVNFSEKLKKLIYMKYFSEYKICLFSDGLSLLKEIKRNKNYDLIILDIDLMYINGIDIGHRIRNLDKNVLFIYISNSQKYLPELFEVETFRYLSKPLNTMLFLRYFKEACIRISESNQYYQFTSKYEIQKILFINIVYFESKNRIIHMHLTNGTEIKFYSKLNNVEQELCSYKQNFIRIHQSYLVNCRFIEKFSTSNVIVCFKHSKNIVLNISKNRQHYVEKKLNSKCYGQTF